MDYIKLANLLFKDYDLTIKECFEAYPKRILPKDAEVVRIAPSPTGYLHIGSVYGAFIDKLIAYHSNGIFYMRLEDTDSKREVENAGDKAYDMLSVFGLNQMKVTQEQKKKKWEVMDLIFKVREKKFILRLQST